MGARYYDPTIGRFTQVDPIALPNVMKNGGSPWFIQICKSGQDAIGALSNAAFNPVLQNTYIYAGNDSINGSDPTGYFRLGKFLFALFETLDAAIPTGLIVGACIIGTMACPVAGILLVPVAIATVGCYGALMYLEWRDF